MKSLNNVRFDYLVFLALHIVTSLILVFYLLDVLFYIPTVPRPSMIVRFLLDFGTSGLLTGIFFGPAFILYGVYQRFSNSSNFQSEQFLTVLLIGAFLFGSSLVVGSVMAEQEREANQDRRCIDIIEARTAATDEAIKVPVDCADNLRDLSELENLEEGDYIKNTSNGFELVETP